MRRGRPPFGRGVFAVLAATVLAAATPAADSSGELPRLTQARQVLNLSKAEADSHHPVELRAVVTFFDAAGSLCFVQDASGGIYVYHPLLVPQFKRGLLVRAQGTSAAGRYSPIVLATNLAVLGEAQMPAAKAVSMEEVVSGSEDSQWVEVEGVVRSQFENAGNLVLDVVGGGTRLPARIYTYPAAPLPRLLDSQVRIQGVVASLFDQAEHLAGFHVLVPSLAEVKVLKGPAGDPFAAPLQPIRSLLAYSPGKLAGQRWRVRGVVTFRGAEDVIYLEDPSGGLRIQSWQSKLVSPGDVIDAAGFPIRGDYMPSLEDAVLEKISTSRVPLPSRIGAEQAIQGDFDNRLVQMEALLLEQVSTPTNRQALLLQAGPYQFNAFFPASPQGGGTLNYPRGSRLQLSGLCTMQTDAHRRPLSWNIWLRSPADVQLVRRPAEWVVLRLLVALILLGAVSLGGVIWMTTLRGQVRRQTEILRRRETALEGRYRDLFENAHDILFTLDPTGHFTSLNQAGERATGYSRTEITEKHLIAVTASKDLARVRELFARVQAGVNCGNLEFEIVAKNGRPVVLEANWHADIRNGQLCGLRGIARDITERKQAEAALRQSEQQLRRFVAEREQLGRNLHDEIIQSIYGVGLGLEDCSHLITHNPPLAETRVKHLLENLNGVIQQVRHYIRSFEPDAPPSQDFAAALRTLTLALDPAQNTRFLFNIDLAAAQRLNSTQVAQLLHIAREAISNSLRHGDPTSTTVTLRSEPSAIGLEIQDDGAGFDPKTVRHDGCGLANMAARAGELGARFALTSEPGHGTRVTVELPIRKLT